MQPEEKKSTKLADEITTRFSGLGVKDNDVHDKFLQPPILLIEKRVKSHKTLQLFLSLSLYPWYDTFFL